MKEFLTEWLIKHGTGEAVNKPAYPSWGYCIHARYKGYLDHTPPDSYRLTPKGLEYIKNESIPD